MLSLSDPAFVGGIRLWGEGGDVSTITVGDDIYRVHVFNSTSSITFNGSGDVEYLIVAGGGGGGSGRGGGGGGGGGYRSSVPGQLSGTNTAAEATRFVTSGVYPIQVGAGGSVNGVGTNSSFDGVESTRGGNGGTYGNTPGCSSGGSGGGGGPCGSGGCGGISGQGHSGGRSDCDYINPVNDNGGGGGGAGSAGTRGIDGGNPGAPLSSNITGSDVFRAGGGWGKFNSTDLGAANSGYGGSGGDFDGNNARAGDSGVVIIRYKVS